MYDEEKIRLNQMLKYFEYEHLPEHLKAVSKPFGDLANSLVNEMGLQGEELSQALRKLLEAKDCAVRAALPNRVEGV